MLIEEYPLAVAELRVGMYVCRLDVPWENTPFPLQGVQIRHADDIDRIGRYAHQVWIDVEKSRQSLDGLRSDRLGLGPGRTLARESEEEILRRHENRIPFEQEIEAARQAEDQLTENVISLLDDLRANRSISRKRVEQTVSPVVQSISRNPDAFMWLRAIRAHGGYAYTHAINCCALAAAFGRYLGYPEDGLQELGAGGLLMDIGMADVPAHVLDTPGPLDAEGWQAVHLHVERGLRRVDADRLAPGEARRMIRFHHERHDGSGYPRGNGGGHIPVAGRIAAIVDAFDAMTSERPYRRALSRAAALQELYLLRGKRYQAEMVEQFLRCLGVYPVGTLVELTHGEVAIVMAQNPTRRLRPRLMVLTDRAKQLLGDFVPMDMAQGNESGADVIHIVRSVAPGSYGLDPQQLFL